ncbi:phage tail protein [Peribacillus asahii]|uniref:phage tail protein n=1 Tax=Peribacillus asahii TaxID=228899 RepID=UPI0037F3D389
MGFLFAHQDDDVKHITAEERTKWNNKLDASTTKKGVVQLNNTVTSTSATQAATANAVKMAYDKAVTGNRASIGDVIVATSLAEVNNGNDSYALRKSFIVPKPGKYRVTFELKAGGAGTTARGELRRAIVGGTTSLNLGTVAISSEFTTTSTNYLSVTLDMNTDIAEGEQVLIFRTYYNPSVSIRNAYLKEA